MRSNKETTLPSERSTWPQHTVEQCRLYLTPMWPLPLWQNLSALMFGYEKPWPKWAWFVPLWCNRKVFLWPSLRGATWWFDPKQEVEKLWPMRFLPYYFCYRNAIIRPTILPKAACWCWFLLANWSNKSPKSVPKSSRPSKKEFSRIKIPKAIVDLVASKL